MKSYLFGPLEEISVPSLVDNVKNLPHAAFRKLDQIRGLVVI